MSEVRRHRKKKHNKRSGETFNIRPLLDAIGNGAKSLLRFANENKLVYVVAASMAVLIAVVIVGVVKMREPATTEQSTDSSDEMIMVGLDDSGQPVYKAKTEVEEEEEDTVLLQYKAGAKEGYMNNCIFLGDSRTVAMVSYGFISDDNALAQIGIAHTSVASNTFTQNSGKQYTLQSYLETHQYPVVYVNYGVNGMYGVSEEKYESTYEKLIDKIIELAPNSQIVLMGIWPVDDYGTYEGKVKNEWIDKYNKWLYETAEKKGLHYLDVENELKGEDGQVKREYDAGDGLHYKACAYTKILEYIISHPVPGVSDEGDFKVKYVAPSGDYKTIMTEDAKLGDNVEVVNQEEYLKSLQTTPQVCNHEYGDWNYDHDATCEDSGYRQRTCTKCGYVDSETISEYGHKFENGKCKRCGAKDPHYSAGVTPTPTPTPTPSSEEPTSVVPSSEEPSSSSEEPSSSSSDEPSSSSQDTPDDDGGSDDDGGNDEGDGGSEEPSGE